MFKSNMLTYIFSVSLQRLSSLRSLEPCSFHFYQNLLLSPNNPKQCFARILVFLCQPVIIYIIQVMILENWWNLNLASEILKNIKKHTPELYPVEQVILKCVQWVQCQTLSDHIFRIQCG